MEAIQDQTESSQYIVVKLSNEQFGINIKHIDNIVRMQKITRVPKVKEYLKGVINLRGEIIPVMSLRLKMGLGKDLISDVTRIIILKVENKEAIGIIVDEVKEVVTLEEALVDRMSFDSGAKAGFVTGVGRLGESLISLLEIDSIISEKEAKYGEN